MPFAAGSSSTAVIGNQVYVAGGIVGSSTTTQAARYTPATDVGSHRSDAPGPQPRRRRVGRLEDVRLRRARARQRGRQRVANGFDTVQIYDPATDSWESSLDPGSTLAPLPQARGAWAPPSSPTASLGHGRRDPRRGRRHGETRLQQGRRLQPRDQQLAGRAAHAHRQARHLPRAGRQQHPRRRRRVHSGGSASTVHEVLEVPPAPWPSRRARLRETSNRRPRSSSGPMAGCTWPNWTARSTSMR